MFGRVAVPLLILVGIARILCAAPVTIAAGTTNDTESRIIRLSDGRLMAAIGRNPYGRWDTTDIYMSLSPDNGANWSAPAPAIGAAGDQATIALLQLPGDTIRLWYGSNESGTYRICTAYSLNGLDWATEGEISLGWSAAIMCYDPTVILEPDSSLTMIYRGGSGTAAGAYVAHRPKGGNWDTSRRMVNAAANRPRIMRHSNGTYLAAFQRKSGASTANIDVFIRRSTNLTAWSDSVRLTTNQNSHDAWCLQIPDSGYVVYYAKYQSAPYDAYNLCRRRSADGISWQPEQQLTFAGSLLHNTQPCLFAYGSGLYRSWTRANDYDNDNDILFERFPLGTAGVTLSGFAAGLGPDGALLSWSTACADDCYRWLIDRSEGSGPYARLAELPAHGNGCGTAEYLYTDRSIESGHTYRYLLHQIDLDGSSNLYGPVIVSAPPASSMGAVQVRHRPNPASGPVTFGYAVGRAAPATLSIYNITGQLVATPLAGMVGAGAHNLVWDCRDRDGRQLAAGVYWYRLTCGSSSAKGRLVVLR